MSYPRLYVPDQMPRQTKFDTSPVTLFLTGKVHEIVLDEIPDGKDQSPFPLALHLQNPNAYVAHFAENANMTAKNLQHTFDMLKDM